MSLKEFKTRVKLSGSCLKQLTLRDTHKNGVYVYIVYELGASTSPIDDPTVKKSFFSSVRLTKNTDIDKYQYSGSGIGFGRKSSFLFPGGRFVENVIIFGADISSSGQVDNKEKGTFSS